jgi:histone H2B
MSETGGKTGRKPSKTGKVVKRSDKKVAKKGKPGSRPIRGSYGRYHYKLFKSVANLTQPKEKFGISKAGMAILDSFFYDLVHRYSMVISELIVKTKKASVTEREVQTATRLLLTGELQKHAVSEGQKASQKFRQMKGKTGVSAK